MYIHTSLYIYDKMPVCSAALVGVWLLGPFLKYNPNLVLMAGHIHDLPENAGRQKIKKKIRSLQRVLKKEGLAATKRSETERALEALSTDLDRASRRNVEKKFAKKYHMVRFFERKKALRALKKSNSGDKELAEWYYVSHWRKGEKYVALYAQGANPDENQRLNQIRKDMADNKLLSGEKGREAALAAAAKSSGEEGSTI